jgi:hypothetical protein
MTERTTKHITPEQILEYVISQDINQWLHKKGDDVHKYVIFLDRVCEISEVIRGSFEKVKNLKGNEGGKCSRIEGDGYDFEQKVP